MIKFLKDIFGGNFVNLSHFAWDAIKDIAPGKFKQALPKWFGWTYDDERIMGILLAIIAEKYPGGDDGKRSVERILSFISTLSPFDQNKFRLVVTGMPTDTHMVETDKGETRYKGDLGHFDEKDTRVIFLLWLADYIHQHSMREAREHLDRLGVIGKTATRQKVESVLLSFRDLCERELCAYFGVARMSDIRPDHLADKIETDLRPRIPVPRDAASRRAVRHIGVFETITGFRWPFGQ